MKKKINLTLIALVLPITVAFADDGDKAATSTDMMNYVGFGAIILALLIFVVALLVILRTVRVITKVAMGAEAYKAMLEKEAAEKLEYKAVRKKNKGEAMLRVFSLKPMSEEHSLLLNHEFDGIRELNNPTPQWFMYLFYATMVFAVVYLLNYHVFHFGQLQYDEYRTEVAIADKEKAAYLGKAANRVDETTVKLSTDVTVLASGKGIFAERCAPCHGGHAQGNVGPNLTDDYWLHGNKINDVFKTIKYGIAAKGMPTWEKQLSPKQIADVASYVKSLHGTNPANPKAPQGEKISETAVAAKADTKTDMAIN